MNPFKIVGGVLIFFGLAFRAISVAYFNQRAQALPPGDKARRRFEASKRRALLIDAAFIVAGIYVLLGH